MTRVLIGSVGEIVRPAWKIAGVDLEEACRFIAAFGALFAAFDGEIVTRDTKRIAVRVPGTVDAVLNAAQVVVARGQRAFDDVGTGFRRHAPPAFAQPILAVETPERDQSCNL